MSLFALRHVPTGLLLVQRREDNKGVRSVVSASGAPRIHRSRGHAVQAARRWVGEERGRRPEELEVVPVRVEVLA